MKAINWVISKLLTGDFLASKIRHLLGFGGGLLVGYNLTSVDMSAQLVDILTQLLTSEQFLAGIGLLGIAERASAANKKVTKLNGPS